jgi:hypothetical protein
VAVTTKNNRNLAAILRLESKRPWDYFRIANNSGVIARWLENRCHRNFYRACDAASSIRSATSFGLET